MYIAADMTAVAKEVKEFFEWAHTQEWIEVPDCSPRCLGMYGWLHENGKPCTRRVPIGPKKEKK